MLKLNYTIVATKSNLARKWLVVRYEKGRNSYEREFEVPKRASDSEIETLIADNAPNEIKTKNKSRASEANEEGPNSELGGDAFDPELI